MEERGIQPWYYHHPFRGVQPHVQQGCVSLLEFPNDLSEDHLVFSLLEVALEAREGAFYTVKQVLKVSAVLQ